MDFLPKLSAFEGPLDLLLHLIEKNKIDIYDIPIAEITDQYMEYLNGAEDEDPDFLSEFLVMAATLIEIKSKMLLPKEKDAEEEDPRAGLVERLLEYKLYKYMSEELKDKEEEASGVFYKEASIPEEVKEHAAPVDYDVLLKGTTLEKLSAVFKEVMAKSLSSEKEEPVQSKKIAREKISLPEKMESLRAYLKKNPKTSFRALIEKEPTKANIIVTFLAVLELMKNGEISASEDRRGKEIDLLWL